MRKLSKRRKEKQKKQQIHGQDDLFCLSTPPRGCQPPPSMKYTSAEPSIAPCHVQSHGKGELKLLNHQSCSLSALCVVYSVCFQVPSFFLSDQEFNNVLFGRKKTTKKLCREKQRCSHPYSAVMFFSLIQFEASPTGAVYCFFHVALAFKLQRKHSWKSVAQKKKKKLYLSSMMCSGHRTHHYVLNLCNLVINVDPVCPIPYLSLVLLNHRESQRLQKLSQWCMSVMQRESHASSSVVLLCPLAL